ncbi:selenoprotein M-like [Nematostella vectensis]|uniref:selenoprotein M-like n=1 Tax=Nematostella vectensis TaxID=45351 RepID=UPI002076F493|nr:selenoprotein M-like [Nematostella vectensis]
MLKAVFVVLLTVACVSLAEEKPPGSKVRARLEVKAFISDDLPYYQEAKIKYNPGHDPVMRLYDDNGKEVKTVDVAEMGRQDIVNLVESHGLKRSNERMREEQQSEEEEEPTFDENEEFPDEEDEDDETTEEPPTEAKEEL